MKPVRVSLGDRSYNIVFGPLSRLPSALRALDVRGRRAFLVTSRRVQAAGHAAAVASALEAAGLRVTKAALADGEHNKTLATVETLYHAGAQAGLDRRSVVVAVGGGVVTDMAGFFAATYMRGISFLSVPTTLLGMVDAAIGGKTGVDTRDGKNLVGAFWQPRLVWNDPAVLKTLPPREWRTGFAEIAKYGLIGDEPFFTWLNRKIAERPSMADWRPADVARALYVSAAAKARVVSGDERETPLAGGREILNFGHTAGHALEAATGYTAFSHGEAISVGMAVVGEISLALNKWSSVDHLRMLSLLKTAGLPIRFPKLTAAQKADFWSALRKDKKNVDARLRFVLPRAIGRVEVVSGIPVDTVRAAAERCGF